MHWRQIGWAGNILKLCWRKNFGIIGEGISFATAADFFWNTYLIKDFIILMFFYTF